MRRRLLCAPTTSLEVGNGTTKSWRAGEKNDLVERERLELNFQALPGALVPHGWIPYVAHRDVGHTGFSSENPSSKVESPKVDTRSQLLEILKVDNIERSGERLGRALVSRRAASRDGQPERKPAQGPGHGGSRGREEGHGEPQTPSLLAIFTMGI